jgi:aminomethyltransferase
MGIGTPLHERTSALCNSLRWKEWSGYFAVCSYETILDFEYTAFRNRAGLLDISPLYKQRIRGRDSERLLDRMVPRDLSKCRVGQVIYTPWCDDDGAVVDDARSSVSPRTTFA